MSSISRAAWAFLLLLSVSFSLSASASPSSAEASKTAPPAEPSCARVEEHLGYAEARATNAENELKKVKKDYDTSLGTCLENVQAQKKSTETLNAQLKELVDLYNGSQKEKAAADVLLSEALAAAKGSEEKQTQSHGQLQKQIKSMAEETRKAEQKVDELKDVIRVQEKLLEDSKRQVLEALAKTRIDGAPQTTVAKLQDVFYDFMRIYRVSAVWLVDRIPHSAFKMYENGLSAVKEQVQAFGSAETLAPLAPYASHVSNAFTIYVCPISATALERAGEMLGKGADIFGDKLNPHVDALLSDVFAHHPDVQTLVGESVWGRICLMFLLALFAYVCARVSVKCVLLPVLSGVCCCCRRRCCAAKGKCVDSAPTRTHAQPTFMAAHLRQKSATPNPTVRPASLDEHRKKK